MRRWASKYNEMILVSWKATAAIRDDVTWFTYILIPFFVHALVLQGCPDCFVGILSECLGEPVSLIAAQFTREYHGHSRNKFRCFAQLGCNLARTGSRASVCSSYQLRWHTCLHREVFLR